MKKIIKNLYNSIPFELKFWIDKNIRKKIEEVENAFDNIGAVIQTTQSKTAKYTSISINVMMESPDSVIEKYIAVSTIEGIISL
jgi:hypothetical protein